MNHDFWRLLGDYETLTRDEATAIRERNFDALADANGKKKAILSELAKTAESLGLGRGQDPHFDQRLDALLEAEQYNTALAGEIISKMRLEAHGLSAATKRLRSVGQVYAAEAPQRSFSADV